MKQSKLKESRSFNYKIRYFYFKAAYIMLITALFSIAGCGLSNSKISPRTLGEMNSGYTYIPLDPTKVKLSSSECTINYLDFVIQNLELLNFLPDNAVRMSIESSDRLGNVTYGVANINSSNNTYKLTADYVNSDTVNKTVWIAHTIQTKITEKIIDSTGKVTHSEQRIERLSVDSISALTNRATSSDLKETVQNIEIIPGTQKFHVISSLSDRIFSQDSEFHRFDFKEYSVPIYVGIGLRIVAEGITKTNNANITGIGVLGIEAEENRISGSLTVQTLGINGESVASALPVQSELNRTTSNNAFVAIGSIKSMLHRTETIKAPRVVGLYLPLPGNKALVNELISELSRNPVTWCPNGYEKPTETSCAETKLDTNNAHKSLQSAECENTLD